MQDLAHQDSQSAAEQPEASGPVPDTGEDALALHAASAGSGNGAAVEVLPPAPRPGGRPKGSLNKATKEVRQVAGKYTLRACRKLWRLANEGKTEDIQLRAGQGARLTFERHFRNVIPGKQLFHSVEQVFQLFGR